MLNIRLFGLIGFLKGLYFYIPIFTFFLLSNDVTVAALLFAQALYSAFVFIGEVPTGVLADKLGQKTAIILGYTIEAVGIALIVLFPTVAGLYVSTILRGLGSSFLSGSEEALLYESVKATDGQDYQKVYGRFISNEHIGYIAATALAGLAYQQLGAGAFVPLIALTAVCILGAAGASLFLTNYRGQIADPSEGAGMLAHVREGLSLIRRSDIIWTLTVVGALTISGEYFIQSVYQPYFEVHGVTAFWIGAVLSLGTVFSMITIRYAYVLEHYLTLEKILFLISGTLAVAYILMAAIPHPLLLIVLYVLMTGLFNLHVPIVSDYINARTKSSLRSTVLSGMSFFRRFFQLFLLLGLSAAVGYVSIQTALLLQGMYLLIGGAVGYYLLVRCGCTYKVANSEGEEFEFDRARL